ncbi:FeoA family protein [Clostridium formicaceticum]|uniref:FeoA domain protein n=1 Tax=Clostridium formicaceticum TaxID=1497 RepID=A0AAC9RIH5_9CLOT|nr:FeoA family protein [Clostridium formicaceticum]AOY75824.1 iron transporter FeoA [Clostridium formicaceticum]ARE86154.1 FeoA domain protein [Clostridium formicaceticum]
MPLYHLQKNNRCMIEKLPVNHLLKSLGVREGMTVSVMSRQPMGGPIVIGIGKRSIAIARDVAEQIFVKEVN